jgi:hypothetical protein
MLEMGEDLLREVLVTLHTCGDERRECVALLNGPCDDPYTVDAAVHPVHRSARGGYEIDADWMHRFWIQLARTGCALRAQAHTHPRAAGHSVCDDSYPAVHTAGFVSLVAPDFARPPVRVEDIHASVLEPNGWRRSTFLQEVRVV